MYGQPDHTNKCQTWDLLRSINHDARDAFHYFGDFNEILSAMEKDGGARRNYNDMNAFRRCLDDCGL